jgi:hypothetical protein
MMLSSQPDHAHHPDWVPIGRGAWDRDRRMSYLCTDRVFALDSDLVRREGAIFERELFITVALLLAKLHGWALPTP